LEFGQDDGANVIFVREESGTEIHMGDVTYRGETAWYFIDVRRECCRQDFLWMSVVKFRPGYTNGPVIIIDVNSIRL
jgi:hypothetical protein